MALPKVGVEAVIEGMAAFEADSKKVNKSLSGMDDSIGNLGKTSTSLTSHLTKLGGSILKVGAAVSGAGLLALGAGLFEAASSGLSMNNAMEQATAKINAFTKDGAKTADILEMIRDRASRTPFEFQEMAAAASGLLPAAKQAGIGLEELIGQAEVLAASNPAEGLEGAAFALKEAVSGDFTSIIERFNLPRTMINQLKEEGIPNLEIVSRTMQELGLDTDLVSALAETAQGRWSTFKDTLTNVAATVTQPIFDTFSKGLGDVNTWLTANEPLLTEMANILANQVTTALTRVGELFTAFQQGGTGGLLTALGLGDFVTMWATVQPILAQLQLWLGTNIPVAVQTLSDLWNNNLLPGFTQIFDAINANLLPAFQQLSDAFLSGTGGTQSFSDLWNNTLLPAIMAVGAFVRDVLFPAWVDLEVFLIGALSIAITTLADYWNNLLFPAISTVSAFVTDTVIPALSDLWDWLEPKLGVAIQTLSDLWTNTLQPALLTVNDYISANIIPLLESLGELFNAVINKALEASAGLWKNVLLPALVRVGDFMRDTITPAFSDVAKVVSDDVSPILEDLGDVILPLLQEGLDFVTESIQDVIGYFDSLKTSVSSFTLPDILTPGSPPPMANAMTDIANATGEADKAFQGFAGSLGSSKKFIDDLNMGGIARQLGRGGTGWKELRRIIGTGVTGSFDQLMTSGLSPAQILGKIQETAKRFNFPPSFAAEFAQANGLIEHLTSSATEFQRVMKLENLGRMVQLSGQLSSMSQGFADVIEARSEANKTQMQYLEEFLKSGEEIRLQGQNVWSQVAAQEELNRLIVEQAEQEKQITVQKKLQQQLGFLQQQVELIKLGKELGGNIFKGLVFGLDAKEEDLLAATNNVISAMVNQINRDLQISSPSKVMARIGQQMMAGLQGGIASMAPVLNAQLSASVAGPLSPAMAGAMSAGATTNNYNTFQVGGNSINNGMDAASFEARVLQVIRRNL